MGRVKNDWNDPKVKERFIYMYETVKLDIYIYTFEDIMKEFNLGDRSTVKNVADRYGLEKRKQEYYPQKSKLNYEQRLFVLNNCDKYTNKEFEEMFSIKERTIREFLNKHDKKALKADQRIYKKEDYLKNEEFKNDYFNLTYSDSYVAQKYGLSYKTLHSWRIEDIGDDRKRLARSLKKTEPESIFEDYLYDLEIPFFYEWKIDNWSIDYYLGQKICIEINGDFWHSRDKDIDKDNRKKQYLESKGYALYSFTESEIINNKDYIYNELHKITALLYRNI